MPGIVVLWCHSEEGICQSQDRMSFHSKAKRSFYDTISTNNTPKSNYFQAFKLQLTSSRCFRNSNPFRTDLEHELKRVLIRLDWCQWYSLTSSIWKIDPINQNRLCTTLVRSFISKKRREPEPNQKEHQSIELQSNWFDISRLSTVVSSLFLGVYSMRWIADNGYNPRSAKNAWWITNDRSINKNRNLREKKRTFIRSWDYSPFR